jgi:hypothetical protein
VGAAIESGILNLDLNLDLVCDLDGLRSTGPCLSCLSVCLGHGLIIGPTTGCYLVLGAWWCCAGRDYFHSDVGVDIVKAERSIARELVGSHE